MDAREYLAEIGNTLGEARQELPTSAFVTLLTFVKDFVNTMHGLETDGLDKDYLSRISALAKENTETILRVNGIEI